MINEKRSFQSMKNNAQGHFFEKEIERACNYYREKNILKCITAVCICFAEGLTERYFFVPFEVWLNMGKHFGKKSVTAENLKMFEIYYKHSIGIDFLKNIKIKFEEMEKGVE